MTPRDLTLSLSLAALAVACFALGFYTAPKNEKGFFNGQKLGFEQAVEMIKLNKWNFCKGVRQ